MSSLPFIDLKSQYAALKPSIDARIQRVLDHGQYIMGPEVKELESALGTFTGAKHCITVASGTEALLIALMAIGLKPGDEVITTPFTFAATAPLPDGLDEFLLAGYLRKKSVELVKCETSDLEVPANAEDTAIELVVPAFSMACTSDSIMSCIRM